MRFEKISRDQFIKEIKPVLSITDEDANKIYDEIKLPRRATIGSAGYDFTFPIELRVEPKQMLKLPTGICWHNNAVECEGYVDAYRRVLMIFPRSSLGLKYLLREPNIVSIIDEDYYGCESNGGHIHVTLYNEGDKTAIIEANKGYAQGIILKYDITEDDDTVEMRTGGFGSTNK